MTHPALAAALVDGLPDLPGIYRFWSDRDVLLYVGKSIHLRQRVASHFSAVQRDPREARLCQATARVDWEVTAGELGALLRESELVKDQQPLFNRRLRRVRQLFTWQPADSGQVRTVALRTLPATAQFGLFRSVREARAALEALVRDHALCPQRVGLSAGRAGQACFQHQLGHCRGVCVGRETPAGHDQRLSEALAQQRLQVWPWPGAVVLCEAAAHGRDYHVLDDWHWLGTADSLDGARRLMRDGQRRDRGQLDRDIYYILCRQLQRAVSGACDLQVLSA